MAFRGSESGISLLDILSITASVVIFIILISYIILSLTPLDFTGHLRDNIPNIVIILAVMIAMIIIIIIVVYVPEIITRE